MSPVDKIMTIGEIATLAGVSYRTLRFYEQQGMLTPYRQGLERLYGTRDKIRLELILKGKRLGFSLREIRAMIEADESDQPDLVVDRKSIAAKIEGLEQKRASVIQALADLQAALDRSVYQAERVAAVAMPA